MLNSRITQRLSVLFHPSTYRQLLPMKQISILFILVLVTYSTYGQKSPEDIANNFFALYKKDSIDMAMNYLFSTNKYSSDSQEGINNLKNNLTLSRSQVGKFIGYELLQKKVAGHDVELLTFLVKHERLPLTFRILFYKPSNDWQVQNFKFDDKVDEELEEASKIYRNSGPTSVN